MTHSIPLTLTTVLAKKDAATFEKALGILTGPGREMRILSEGRAFDLDLSETDSPQYQTEYGKALADEGIIADICVQLTKGRRKKLLICDMDSTLIGQECIDELADFAGVKPRVSEITERAMRGELNFESALKERVGLLKGLPLSTLERCFKDRITLNDGARILARTMKHFGAKTVIVSGGFTYFSQRVAEKAGFDVHQANILEDDGTALSGTVTLPILGREAKQEALLEHSFDIGGVDAALAIGDGANDLAMITRAGLGIAYRAKPAVAAAAHCAINATDLTTALYFQGYSETDFVLD